MGCSSCGGVGVGSFKANIGGFSAKRMKTIKNRLSGSLAKKNVQKSVQTSNRNQKPNRIVKSKGFSKGFKMSYKR